MRFFGKRGRPGRGTLFIISGLLIGSAVMRAGHDAGQAFARTPEAEDVSASLDMPPTQCETPEKLRDMLVAFGQREADLDQREKSLRQRMRALQVADEKIADRLAELERAEQTLRDTIAMAETASETDLDKLTRVYESMKPKQAAALFEEMDPNFAAGFLGRMRPEAAAEIMAGLTPEAAHLFSVVLAGRNAEVPRE